MVQMKSTLTAAALVASLGIGAAACGGGSAAKPPSGGAVTSNASGSAKPSKSPYTIHAILSLSGQASFLGKPEQKTLELYVQQQNQKGGIDGHPLKLSIQDDETNPKTTVQLMTSLQSQHVPFVIGPSLGATVYAVAPLVENNGPVDYALSPTINPKAGSYLFSAVVSFPSETTAVLRWIESQGWTRVAFLDSTDASGHAADVAFQATLKQPAFKNLNVVTWQHFDVSASTVSAQMTAIAAAKPQVLISFATGTPLGTVLRGMSQSAVTSVPVITDDGNMTYVQMHQYQSFLPKGGVYFASGRWDAGSILTNPAAKAAVNAFFQAFSGSGIKPDMGYALAWDPVNLIMDAVKKYGVGATAKQIHDYLESQTAYEGLFGKYNFSLTSPAGRQRGLSTSDAYIYQWKPASDQWVPVSSAGGGSLVGGTAGASQSAK